MSTQANLQATTLDAEQADTPAETAAPSSSGFYYKLQFFVCINRRNNSRSCAGGGSEQLQEYAKRRARQLNLPETERVRINKSGCLGRCEHGPVAVVYPGEIWYRYRTKEDIDEIISEHVGRGRIVERLRVPKEEEES